MTLPYDIARCAGERDGHGTHAPQCGRCARQIYNTPAHCYPHRQSWIEPHSHAHDEACPNYITPQPTKTTP